MKLVGLFDAETGFAGGEMVMELVVVLLYCVTEFLESIDGDMIELNGLFNDKSALWLQDLVTQLRVFPPVV